MGLSVNFGLRPGNSPIGRALAPNTAGPISLSGGTSRADRFTLHWVIEGSVPKPMPPNDIPLGRHCNSPMRPKKTIPTWGALRPSNIAPEGGGSFPLGVTFSPRRLSATRVAPCDPSCELCVAPHVAARGQCAAPDAALCRSSYRRQAQQRDNAIWHVDHDRRLRLFGGGHGFLLFPVLGHLLIAQISVLTQLQRREQHNESTEIGMPK